MNSNYRNIRFARIGGLSSVKQKGYDPSMPTYHSPPARKGIYAFVYPHFEPFLLSGGFSNMSKKHGKHQRVKDKFGEVITMSYDEDWEPYSNNWLKFSGSRQTEGEVYEVLKPKKPKIFKYQGDIWHHLEVKHHEIIKSKGCWVLTDFKSYCKALKKDYAKSIADLKKMKIYDVSNPYYYLTKDHLEVFIEKV